MTAPPSTPASTSRRAPLVVRVIGGLFFTAIFAVLALIVTELVLQTSSAQSVYREVQRHPPHPFLQVLPGMIVDHVNAQGFRGDDIQLVKPPHAFRVIAIGGSTTLGVSNPYAESYPFLLQVLLRERHPGVTIEVVNAGAPWYTTAHDLVAYEIEARQFNPDVVIFFEAINDLTRSFSPPWLAKGEFKPDYSHYLGPYARMQGPDTGFVEPPSPLLTWNVLRRWWTGGPDPYNTRDPDNVAKVAARLRPIDAPAFRSLPSFRRYYDAVIHAVQADGHAILTASQPSLFRPDLNADEQRLLYFGPLMCADQGTYPSLAAMVRGMGLYNDTARQIAGEDHVPFVDFDAAVPKTPEYFSDDVHMRKAANAILARLAADAIDADHLVEAAATGDGHPKGR